MNDGWKPWSKMTRNRTLEGQFLVIETWWQTVGFLGRAAARRELIRGKAAMLLADEAKRKFQAKTLYTSSGSSR